MERKIILELIKKDISEIQLLIEAMTKKPDPDNILLEVTTSRTQTLLNELSLLRAAKNYIVAETNLEPEPVVENEVEAEDKVVPRLLSGEAENAATKDEDEAKDEVEKNTNNTQEETKVVEPEKNVVDIKEIAEKVDEEVEEEVEEVIVEPQKEEIATTIEEEIKKPQFLGEQFSKEPSLNERFSDLKQTRAATIAQPINNLRKAIGLNDRFMFTRELFNNDSATFDKTIDALDNVNNIIDAVEYLEQNFKWKKTDTSLKFMDLVKRRHGNTASD